MNSKDAHRIGTIQTIQLLLAQIKLTLIAVSSADAFFELSV